jgi:hypothetical protein
MSSILKKYFKNFSLKSWQHQKNSIIFASLKLIMQRTLIVHIERANRFSPKGGYSVCGACSAAE